MNDWVSQEALLTEGYRRCANLTLQYGTTHFWGAALLPRPQRKHVDAVYALCRLANDIVDLPNGQHPLHSEHVEERESEGSTSSAYDSDDGIFEEPNPTIPERDVAHPGDDQKKLSVSPQGLRRLVPDQLDRGRQQRSCHGRSG
jgi:hypothetical protein